MKRFTIYDEDVKSALQLIKKYGDKTNEVIDNFDKKTDKKGNHEGSWQGLNKPTLSEEGMRSTVEILVEENEKINNKLEYIYLKNIPSYDPNNAQESLLEAIELAELNNNKILLPGETIVLSGGINIKKPITIEGIKGKTILRFNGAEQFCISLGDNTSQMGFILRDFTIYDTTRKMIGLKINNNQLQTTSIVDSVFDNLRIENCNIGISGSYSWDNLFTNVRTHNCNTSLDFQSQFNNNNFTCCRFSSQTDFGKFINNENIVFDTCDIVTVSNLVFHTFLTSSITFRDCYFESLENFGVVTSTNDLTSKLKFDGGLLINGNISIGGKEVMLDFNNFFKGSSFKINQQNNGYLMTKINSHSKNNIKSVVLDYNGGTYNTFSALAGGGGIVSFINRDNTSFTTNYASQGVKLTENLVIGKQYTLLMRVKSSHNLLTLIGQTSSNLSINVNEWNEIIIPFVATTSTISWLIGQNTYLIDYIGIVEGLQFNVPRKEKVLKTTTIPTQGSFNVGDRVYNALPSVGQPKSWVCTNSNPLTFVSEGNL